MPPKRMTDNPVRPARHRPGKPLIEASSSSEDSASEDEAPAAPAHRPPPPKAASAPRIAKVNVAAQRRKQEAEKARLAAAEREKLEKKAAAEGFVTESEQEEGESEEQESDEEESEDDSSEEESSEEEEEEEEEEQPKFFKPRFIPRHKRTQEGPDEETKAAEQAAQRKAETDALIEERVKRDLAAKQKPGHWAADDVDDAAGSDVDDTDGLDPAAELAAFRLRKLKRYKRDREAMLAREREIEEVERRRNMTEAERQAEDEAKVARQQEEKASRGKMAYLQKYFHGGAFYREEAEEAGLAKRDVMGARFVDEVDRSTLPEYMQRRDLTRLGRKGASKYKDLKSEDTGRWGDFDRPERRDNNNNNFRGGGDERFREDDRFRPGMSEGKGANSIPLGGRKVVGAPTGPRTEREDKGQSRKRRSASPDRDRGEKRRKVEA